MSSPCGSGKTILLTKMAEASQKNGKTVWFILPRVEIMEQTIETFERCGVPRNTVHIGMIMTMANHLEELPKPDLIIYDECHMSVSNTYNKISNAFPDAFIIGATASPVRSDNRPLGDLYETMVQGVTVKWLIDNHFLAPFDYYSVNLNDVCNGEIDDEKALSELLTKSKIYGDVIKNWKELGNNLQTVVYCCSVKHSKDVTEAFNNAGIKALHFDGTTPAQERKEIVQKFRNGEIKVLCNCDLISMGFDMPDIGCVMLLRPSNSASLYIQQSGRALRFKPNKKAIIIDMVGNYTRFQLPDEPYEWTLEKSYTKRKNTNPDGSYAIRQCSECFKVFKTASVCPYCGFEYAVKGRELEQMQTVALRKISEQEKEELEKRKKSMRMEVGMARTKADLIAIARERGYKIGWVFQMMKLKGIKG